MKVPTILVLKFCSIFLSNFFKANFSVCGRGVCVLLYARHPCSIGVSVEAYGMNLEASILFYSPI